MTQSKKYYDSINQYIISPNNTYFFCSFIVMLGFVNFKENEKKNY